MNGAGRSGSLVVLLMLVTLSTGCRTTARVLPDDADVDRVLRRYERLAEAADADALSVSFADTMVDAALAARSEGAYATAMEQLLGAIAMLDVTNDPDVTLAGLVIVQADPDPVIAKDPPETLAIDVDLATHWRDEGPREFGVSLRVVDADGSSSPTQSILGYTGRDERHVDHAGRSDRWRGARLKMPPPGRPGTAEFVVTTISGTAFVAGTVHVMAEPAADQIIRWRAILHDTPLSPAVRTTVARIDRFERDAASGFPTDEDAAALAMSLDAEVVAVVAGDDPYRNRVGRTWCLDADAADPAPLVIQRSPGVEPGAPVVIFMADAGATEWMPWRGPAGARLLRLVDAHSVVLVAMPTPDSNDAPHRLDAAIDTVLANHDVDPDRIVLIGHGVGADRAAMLAATRADRLREVVAIAGLTPHPKGTRLAPLHVFAGGLDGRRPAADLRQTWQAMYEDNLPVEWTADPDQGRTGILRVALEPAFDWLLDDAPLQR